jgi:intein/homing endonuclease
MNFKKNNSKIILSKTTAYLTGIVIGDGNLSGCVKSKKTDLSKDYKITIDISDKEHLIFIHDLIKSMIKTKTEPRESTKRENRLPRLYIQIRNKELYNYFNKIMCIPAGAKSSIVFVPDVIKNSSDTIKKYFLAGYFDADGGFRGKSLGFTTASKRLWDDIKNLLDYFNIFYSNDIWINKKYNKKYYGIRLKRKEIDNFLNIFPLQNKEKLDRINQRFLRGDAGVAKRACD